MEMPVFFSAVGIDENNQMVYRADGIIDFKKYDYELNKVKDFILNQNEVKNKNIAYIHLIAFSKL